MKGRILLVGYGSIGKRHARNLIDMGIRPYILTKHPDKFDAIFLKDINILRDKDISHCIISSPTARHLEDLRKCLTTLRELKKILIEKPLECSYSKGKEINRIVKKYKLEISIGYNLRFLKAFDAIKKFVKEKDRRIKIVEVVAGQDLREWRAYKDIRHSYSGHRKLGGGVDLDLSHEIDYILCLFGDRFKKKFIYRSKISNLKIDSPDIFKLILDYKKFIVDVTLDYIRRPKQRYLRIICDDRENLYYDFVAGTLKIDRKLILNDNDIDQSYKKMLRAFLGFDRKNGTKLCSVKEGLDVLRVLGV